MCLFSVSPTRLQVPWRQDLFPTCSLLYSLCWVEGYALLASRKLIAHVILMPDVVGLYHITAVFFTHIPECYVNHGDGITNEYSVPGLNWCFQSASIYSPTLQASTPPFGLSTLCVYLKDIVIDYSSVRSQIYNTMLTSNLIKFWHQVFLYQGLSCVLGIPTKNNGSPWLRSAFFFFLLFITSQNPCWRGQDTFHFLWLP